VLDLSALAGVTGKRPSELPPFPEAALLDLSALTGVVAYEPSELVVTALPATKLSTLEALLARDRQHLAFEPPDLGPLFGQPAGRGTLGGALGCNLAGPRRLKAGPARDSFVGVRGVSGRGESFHSGAAPSGDPQSGDLPGVDLPKLMAGSFGTLAVVTEVTVKVVPLPETERTVALAGLDETTAMRACAAALHGSHGITGAAHLPAELTALSSVPEVVGAGQSLTLFRIDGFERAVAARMAQLPRDLADYGLLADIAPEAARRLWREIAGVQPFVVRKDRLVWRLMPPPGTAAGVVAAIRRTLALDALYDWGGGLVWLGLDPAAAPADAGAAVIRAALAGAGEGHAQLVRAPEALRRAVPVFQPHTPAQTVLAVRIKDRFDPKRILNRGRMYPNL